jgi:hypothetical protein
MGVEQPRPNDHDHRFPGERLAPNHFYAAYVFDRPASRDYDISTLIEQAQKFGYPVRYWWLSDAMDIGDEQTAMDDRLIVCVHHPHSGENAGMDLYSELYRNKVAYDELDAATVDEYRRFSRALHGPGDIDRPDGQQLFPAMPRSEVFDELRLNVLRELEPLVAYTVGDVQSVAMEALGRALTEAELLGIATQMQEHADHKLILLVTALEHQAQIENQPGHADTVRGMESDFLVYYSLGGLALVRAASERAASDRLFADLHTMIGRSDSEGVSSQQAYQLRLHELDIDIELVEALPFSNDGAESIAP